MFNVIFNMTQLNKLVKNERTLLFISIHKKYTIIILLFKLYLLLFNF